MNLRSAVLSAILLFTLGGCVPAGTSTLPQATVPATQPDSSDDLGAPALSPNDSEDQIRLDPDALLSYLAKTEVRIDILSPEEKLLAWTIVDMRADRDAPSQPVSVSVQDLTESAEGVRTEIVLAEDAVFLRGPQDDSWLKFSRSDSTMILPRMLGPVELAEQVGESLPLGTRIAPDEEISGVHTVHYQYTGERLAEIAQGSFAPGGHLISGQLDLWVAPAGYIKQAIQELVVEDEFGVQTRHMLTMVVLEDNLPQTIAVPGPDSVQPVELPAVPTSEPVDSVPTPGSR